ENLDALRSYCSFLSSDLDWGWRSTAEFFQRLDDLPLSHNVVGLVGHGSIRIAVMGFAKRSPTIQEAQEMSELVAEAMQAGAVGMSSGLIYAPGSYAQKSELIELCRVVRRFGG